MKKLPIVRWFDDLKSALSIYIAGNVAPSGGVTAGKFYFWKGKLRLPTSNIAAGETLTDSNMSVVPEGGLNKVNEKIGDLDNAVNVLQSTKPYYISGFTRINFTVPIDASVVPFTAPSDGYYCGVATNTSTHGSCWIYFQSQYYEYYSVGVVPESNYTRCTTAFIPLKAGTTIYVRCKCTYEGYIMKGV